MSHNRSTLAQKQYIRAIVQNLSLKRLTDLEIVDYLRNEKQIEISRSSVAYARVAMEKEASKWYIELRDSQHKYIAAYKQRIDSLLSYQKTLHEIITNTKKDEVKIRAISELTAIEIHIFNLWRQLPALDLTHDTSTGNSMGPQQSEDDINGRERAPWTIPSWLQCGGCKRWWKNEELLQYHKNKSNNPICRNSSNKIPAICRVEDFTGVEESEKYETNPWADWIKCDGCKRWWEKQDLLDYHKRLSTNLECKEPNIA